MVFISVEKAKVLGGMSERRVMEYLKTWCEKLDYREAVTRRIDISGVFAVPQEFRVE